MQSSYPDFRKRLDAVLSRRDPAALRDFLVAEGQWDVDTATDPERAMWMMIATSPALSAMHAEAIAWLSQHGHAEEAQALGGKGNDPASRSRRSGTRGGQRHQSNKPQSHRHRP